MEHHSITKLNSLNKNSHLSTLKPKPGSIPTNFSLVYAGVLRVLVALLAAEIQIQLHESINNTTACRNKMPSYLINL